MPMKQLSLVIAVLTLAALALAGTVAAAKPFVERTALGPVTYGAGELCSFPVLLEPTAPDVLATIISGSPLTQLGKWTRPSRFRGRRVTTLVRAGAYYRPTDVGKRLFPGTV
jgi:hypothetical protein